MGWLCLLFLLFTSCQFNSTCSSSSNSSAFSSLSSRHLCHSRDSSVLLQFKNSFSIDTSSKFDDYYLPVTTLYYNNRTISWQKGKDCCEWSGVTCEKVTGHVIGLNLGFSGLQGNIHSNSSLFFLRHLKSLDLSENDFKGSPISPKFGGFVSMTQLDLSNSNFSGPIPSEISLLSNLVSLNLSQYYYKQVPTMRLDTLSLNIIIQNLTNLRELLLYGVDMSSVIPDSFKNLSSSLTTLNLFHSHLQGKFPESIFRLPKLRVLKLKTNQNLTGSLPNSNWSSPLEALDLSYTRILVDWHHLTRTLKSLRVLHLNNCTFIGSYPASLGNLTQITELFLTRNGFGGQIPWSLLNHGRLTKLGLSGNNYVGQFPEVQSNTTGILSLHDFSKRQLVGPIPRHLTYLTLSENSLNGTIPSWLGSLNSLELLQLRSNFLTGTVGQLRWKTLEYLDLSNNSLQGELPAICNLSMLRILDLSNNKLSGKIHRCIGNFSQSLSVLDLRKNKFHGVIPETFSVGNVLRNLDLNGNQLEGPLPSSLLTCTELEVLDLGNNKIHDTFPNWLEFLPKLQVLILRSNQFHGEIGNPKNKFPFQKLRIMDLSHNQFSGPLPTKHLENLKAMINSQEHELKYMGDDYYHDTVVVVIKGFEIEMVKIQTFFTTIDFSNNTFRGEIPNVIGKLKSLKGLNFSHNELTGTIPPSFGDLSNLEWLDLSSNRLAGDIPAQLANLTSLEKFNVSENQLVGPIPHGNQFDTFQSDSYGGNVRLCGFAVAKTCSPHQSMPSSLQQEDDLEHGSVFDWKVVLMGYASGVVIGISMGYLVLSNETPDWFVKVVGRKRWCKITRRCV